MNGHQSRLYDEIGVGYARFRRPDQSLLASLVQHLSKSATVANIGAGAGSYETDACVVAVEPSWVMVKARGALVPAVLGVAERLPLASDSVDACTAIMTVQHWSKLAAGLSEMARVASSRVVILTYLPGEGESSWLSEHYFPGLDALNDARYAPIDAYVEAIGPPRLNEVALIPYSCTDGFLDAYWARPEMYLDPEIRSASSSLRSVEGDPAWGRLRSDLETGAWDSLFGELRCREAIDLGYRWLVWDL